MYGYPANPVTPFQLSMSGGRLGMAAFRPARAVDVRPLSRLQAAAVAPAFAGLGDWFTDAVGAASGAVNDLIGTVTGAKAQREAQQQALELARIKAQQAQVEAQASQALWQRTLPAVAIAGAIGIVGLGLVLSSGRK